MEPRWTLAQASNQAGRVAVVTGANTGLGYETALALAGKGARVIMACRNQEKAEDARNRIAAQFPEAQVEVRLIDTGSLSSVREFADDFHREHDRLDLLVNNAGIMMTPYFATDDGIEGQFAVNYLGHFLLTGLLLPQIIATSGARVVNLYSVAHRWGGIQFDDIMFKRQYDPRKSYAQSKMACLMFGLELDRRLRAAGHDARSFAAHPGFSESELSRHLPAVLQVFLRLFGRFMLQSTAAGALPTLYAALGEDLQGGEATGPASRGQIKGPPVVVNYQPEALDERIRARLWDISEQLCDFHYAL